MVLLRGSVLEPCAGVIRGRIFSSGKRKRHNAGGPVEQHCWRVPKAGETVDYDGLRFEIPEANQRKSACVRVRPRVVAASAADAAPH